MKLHLQPVTILKGVGQKLSEKLQNLGIVTLQDLLFHLPLRYEDRTHIWPISDLYQGAHVTILGEIQHIEVTMGRKRMLICRIHDANASVTLRYFNFNQSQKNAMQPGRIMRAYGEVKRGRYGWEIIHPDYKIADSADLITVEDLLTPIYPTTEGIKQLTLRNLTQEALALLRQSPPEELLPQHLNPFTQQFTLGQALQLLHRPPPEADIEELQSGQHPAQQRLILEELTAHQLSMLNIRSRVQRESATPLEPCPELTEALLKQLSFQPTSAQQRVCGEIRTDMAQAHPMLRLVQGDVGSGKTLVAAITALQALGHGCQVAMMAPTEILAEQHALSFTRWFEPMGFKVDWLAGKQKGKAREEALTRIASGETKMVIGTHAIFQQQVQFAHLVLVIIDEQHRFGVHQRLALREKAGPHLGVPHQLIMTATPIPRTLAMTAYADLSLSIIDELPPGRTPITTVVVSDERRDEVINRVYQACHNQGRQAYWVCTLIEESEALQCQAAEETASQLQKQLVDLRIGLVHGRMKPQEKQWVMESFKQHELDLLIATTVIEVGVDVPNASLMIIENPERLGLAQLHQLRGRVGRGQVDSHCLLMYHSPLSKTAAARLAVIRETTDGFAIAQRDMEIRGPGELLGTRQTGLANFKITDLLRDQALIPLASELAEKTQQEYPEQVQPLIERWIGKSDIYTNA